MPINDGLAVDLPALIRRNQERRALTQSLKLARDGAEQFRPAPGQMTGYTDLTLRIIDAIEKDVEQYSDPVSVAGALLGFIAGIFGGAIGALPDTYGADPMRAFNEAGARVLPSYKACLAATYAENHPPKNTAKAEVEKMSKSEENLGRPLSTT